MESEPANVTGRRKRRLPATILAVSLVLNGLLLGKIVIFDPNVPLQPICYIDPQLNPLASDKGPVYVAGVTNARFRLKATGPWLSSWMRFGFRRTEDQIYISLYDYLTKGKNESLSVMGDTILNTHDALLHWLETDPAYIKYATEHGPIGPDAWIDCEFTRLVTIERAD